VEGEKQMTSFSGKPRSGETARTFGGRAIVIGASMAGMLAARVLSETFAQVTVLERDVISGAMEGRAGVPQARHLHALLPKGRRILEEFFPGITAEFQAAGAEILDVANDIAWLTPQGWGVRFPSDLEAVTSTRDLLDWVVRKRLSLVPNVEILDGCEVKGLAGLPKEVHGVRASFRSETTTDTLQADFVVVATGRNSPVSRWLSELGLPEPETTRLDAHVGYASRMFRRPERYDARWRSLFIQAAPPAAKRAGILFPVERGRWLVTLQGGDRDYPPIDDAGFLEFARSLRSPMLYEAIKNAHPLTPVSSYRATENRLWHYERLTLWPDRLAVLGDAVCAFNPVYGQGMTTAALAAFDLRSSLKQSHRGFEGVGRRFQRRLARINRPPWMLATSEDLRFAGAEGGSPGLGARFMHTYLNEVLRAATHSRSVRARFLEVQGMLKGPTAIFRPSVVAAVLRQMLGRNSMPASESQPLSGAAERDPYVEGELV
jgi:2-polyprenyl-6-methoxyphenol hydroxylase-like FAD-dependent oxidoreductase